MQAIKKSFTRNFVGATADRRFTNTPPFPQTKHTQPPPPATPSPTPTHTTKTQTQTTYATFTYDAFGNPVSSSGSWSGPFQYGGNFGYQTDPDSNLKLLGHRYYDASTGRFITRDTAKDGRNWFAYAASNPISRGDTFGEAVVELRYRPVTAWQYHIYIVVVDENTGEEWAISGGPASHDPKYPLVRPVDADPIQIFEGPLAKGHYDFVDKPSTHARLRVIDDDSDASEWINKFSTAGKSMRLQQVHCSAAFGPNSNTVAKHLLLKVGVEPPQKHPRNVWGWADDWPEIWSLSMPLIAN